MVDIEATVFTKIATALRKEFTGIFVTGEYVNAPAKFPFVSIVEADNYTDSRFLDTADQERYARLMYEVNVYSNKEGTKKSECRKILNFIDQMLHGLDFTRISMNPVPNLEDAKIYRLNARYEVVSDGETTFRR